MLTSMYMTPWISPRIGHLPCSVKRLIKHSVVCNCATRKVYSLIGTSTSPLRTGHQANLDPPNRRRPSAGTGTPTQQYTPLEKLTLCNNEGHPLMEGGGAAPNRPHLFWVCVCDLMLNYGVANKTQLYNALITIGINNQYLLLSLQMMVALLLLPTYTLSQTEVTLKATCHIQQHVICGFWSWI